MGDQQLEALEKPPARLGVLCALLNFSTVTHSDKQISSIAAVNRLSKINALWTSASAGKSNRKTEQISLHIILKRHQVATLQVITVKSVVSEPARSKWNLYTDEPGKAIPHTWWSLVELYDPF